MCVNQYLTHNIYTHRDLYVKCGKCPACLQEKAAHRLSRIKNTMSDDLECAMLSLTYNRFSAPYIDRQEAYDFSKGRITHLNVYRDTSYRRVRYDASYDTHFKCQSKKHIIDTIDYIGNCDFSRCRDLAKQPGKIGVAFYPDLQKFMARLRLNLVRDYKYEAPFKVYCCSEYGTKSLRPHFHLLFFIRKGDFEIFRNAVVKSWPFSNLSLWPRAFEKCFRGSSYVASYVNCGSRFPTFLKTYFKPKHSYSKGFGVGNALFNLSSILSHFDRGLMSFGMQTNKNGFPTIVDVPFPAYVVHRYFPKFKGYSRIHPSSLCQVMSGISNFDYDTIQSVITHDVRLFDSPPLYYSKEEFNKISVCLNNAYKRFIDNCPDRYKYYTFLDYALLHAKIWRLHSSTVLRLHLQNDDLFIYEKYDNLEMVKYRYDIDGTLPPGFLPSDLNEINPNKYPHNVLRTQLFEQSYHDNIKHRSVTNAILMTQSDEW